MDEPQTIQSNNKNVGRSKTVTQAFLVLLAADQLPVLDYLDGTDDPLEIFKLMYVCKAMRRAAARKLRALQEEPATKWKQQCFDQWLQNPCGDGGNSGKWRRTAYIRHHGRFPGF